MFWDRPYIFAGLDLLHETRPITEVIEGGAPGFDLLAREWAMINEIPVATVDADWERFGPAAGPIRNGIMAKMGPDCVFAGPGGPGTASMVKIAQAHGIQVVYLERMPVIPSKKWGAEDDSPLRRIAKRA
jgi:hypothetical protein